MKIRSKPAKVIAGSDDSKPAKVITGSVGCPQYEALAELGISSVKQFNQWTTSVPSVVGYWAGDALLAGLQEQDCAE